MDVNPGVFRELAFRAAVCQSLLIEQVCDTMHADETKHATTLGLPEPHRVDVMARARTAVYRRLAELAHDHLSHIPEHVEYQWQISNDDGDLGEYAWHAGGAGEMPDWAAVEDGDWDPEVSEEWPWAVMMVPVMYTRWVVTAEIVEDDDDLGEAAAALGEVVGAMVDADPELADDAG